MKRLNQNTLQRVEEYIRAYQSENGQSPSYRKIMHGVGMSSLNLVQTYVLALERAGRIERTSIGNIEMPLQLKSGATTLAPLIGDIACGQPSLAVEQIEGSYALPRTIFGEGKLFLLRAFGNSMIEAGINKGDLLVLRQQPAADDGEIVVALIDGNATLKRLYHKGNKIVLHPENKQMKDIIVDKCEVQGVLVSCIKMY